MKANVHVGALLSNTDMHVAMCVKLDLGNKCLKLKF